MILSSYSSHDHLIDLGEGRGQAKHFFPSFYYIFYLTFFERFILSYPAGGGQGAAAFPILQHQCASF